MKSIIITFIASFLMLVDLSGQWEIVIDIFPLRRNETYRDVCFINQNTGFIISNWNDYHKVHTFGGIVLKTNNGGHSWDQVFSPGGVQFGTCIFTNNQFGYISGDVLYKTSDGGITWIKDENGTLGIRNLFFVNEQNGFIIADTSIYKTTSGGESWERIFSCKGLNSIFFIDDSTGWGVGEAGLILRLTKKGTSEKIASGTKLPLKKVFFIDRNTGWIAGGYSNSSDGLHPVLLKTINGGELWSKIENVNWLINDFHFRNNQEGWVVGSDSTGKGIIVETNDGGNNWSVQVDSLRSIPLIATDFKDGYGWAIDRYGLVLKKDFSFITGIKENDAIFNNKTILFQNYPNPFSTKTTIKYQLPVITYIDLSVYNITGWKVKTLVNERQQAGRYEVEWNTIGMTPGVYFCELKAGLTRKVLKMILIL